MKGIITIEIDDSALSPEEWDTMVDEIEGVLMDHSANFDLDDQHEEKEEE